MTTNGARGPDEVIAELAKVLRALDKEVSETTFVLKRSERNRFSLLVVHAIAGIAVSLMFVGGAGGPGMRNDNFVVIREVPGFPYSLGAILMIGGFTLLIGTFARNIKAEIAGLTLLYLWYVLLAFTLLVPVLKWMVYVLHWSAGPPVAMPALHPWAVYAHLAIVMRVHIYTLHRFRHARKPGEEIGHVVHEEPTP